MNTTVQYYCDILKEEYNTEGRNVTCTLHCSVKLHEFEHQHFHFTESFIRKHLSCWIPTVKTIYNYTLKNPVVAKFYILPSNSGTHTAKVLEYNDDYYRKVRNIHAEKRLQKDTIIDVKQIPGVYIKGGETSSIDYCETFKSVGVAKCHPDDEFDETIGTLTALRKAMYNANKTMVGVLTELQRLLSPVMAHIDRELNYIKMSNQ